MKLPVNIPWLDIEIVRGCFLNCRWCPLEKNTQYKFMDIDFFERIIDEMIRFDAGYTKIDLFRWGEPFLYPDIKGLLAILEGKRWTRMPAIELYTNGMVLNNKQALAIAESPLEIEIIFSIDGVGDKESYEYIRQGAKWETVHKNISMLSEYIQGSSDIGRKKISVSTIIPHQEGVDFKVPGKEEIQNNFKREFGPRGVTDYYYRGIHRYNGDIILDGMLPKEEVYGECYFVKRGGISILVDGKVSACCADMAGKVIVGDLRKQALDDIYYGEKLSSMRESMLMGERHKLEVCGQCDLR